MPELHRSLGFFTTDASLVVRSWDAWLARVTGIPAERARGQPLAALVPDLAGRGLLARFERVAGEGVVETLAPAFHHFLIPCPPLTPSRRFAQMQQRVTLAPLREDARIVGVIVTMEDVTGRLDHERDLAEQLTSPDERVRLQAAEALAQGQEEASALPLTGVLGDESWRVRRAAVDGLAQRPAPEALRELLRALREQHQNVSVLNSALQALALSGMDAVAPLIAFLGDPDAELRTYAALALGEQANPEAVPALIAALSDADPNVRYHAVEALGKLKAAEAADALAAIAASGDFFLGFPALDALTRIGDPTVVRRVIPLLADPLLCTPAADTLGQIGGEEVAMPLAEMLDRPEAPVVAIAQALCTLHDRFEKLYGEGAYIADLARPAIGAAGLRRLLDALDGARDEELRPLALVLGWLEGRAAERALTRLLGQPSARREVVEALVRHGARVTSLLVEQLAAEDLETRQAAVIALGRIGDMAAVPALVRTLTGDERLAIVAAGALAKIGDRRAFEALLELMGHADAAVRQAVISALNSLGHPDMPGIMAERMRDPDPRVRESAVKIAGYFGYDVCIEPLLICCHDPDETVRRAAVEHVSYLDDPRALPTLLEAARSDTPKVRAGAMRALAYVEAPEVHPHLLAALTDPDPWVRYYAARAIGHHAFADALDALTRVAHADPAHHVRAAAIEAIGQIGGVRGVATLAPLAESDERDLTRAALNALGQVGHPDAMPPLLAALRSPDQERRLDAIHALGSRGDGGAASALQWAAATENDPAVAQAAVDALARQGSQEAVDALVGLTADPARREACIAALSGMGEAQIGWLSRGLHDLQPGVRRAMVETLARMKRSRASDEIIPALNDSDATVRLAAVMALSRLGGRRAERQLAGMAHFDADLAVRRAAQAALQK
ncbi:MAG: HEAT repeat domain-containing protein [Chloroflexi bacterium]|nr:HEAT repeat domain-containing protein [Chloroflexota bacterium]